MLILDRLSVSANIGKAISVNRNIGKILYQCITNLWKNGACHFQSANPLEPLPISVDRNL